MDQYRLKQRVFNLTAARSNKLKSKYFNIK